MVYPCSHAFCHRVVPLSVNNFALDWWLVQLTPMDVEVETTPFAVQTALKIIANDYVNASNYRKRTLLDHVLTVPEAGICDPARVQTRGRPTWLTRWIPSQFEHVVAALDAPVRLRRCRICQATVHNDRTYHQPSPALGPSAVEINFQVVLPSTVDLEVRICRTHGRQHSPPAAQVGEEVQGYNCIFNETKGGWSGSAMWLFWKWWITNFDLPSDQL